VSVQAAALLINVVLAILKAWIGVVAGSRALIADALNSSGDVVATTVAWLAFRFGRKPPDDNHPYGHHNAEALAGLLIGSMICATGAAIAFDSLVAHHTEEPPGTAALWVAVATAAVKLWLYRVSISTGRRLRSPTLLASARDHIADVIAGLGAFVGILLARLGFPAADAVAAVGIGIWVFVQGIEPIRANVRILMHEAPAELTLEATAIARAVEGVERVTEVRIQPIGGHYRMDVTIEVVGSLSVHEGHGIAHDVERAIRATEDSVREVLVHVEPSSDRTPRTDST
jgi:cation diffusion facilitator family transporter